MLHIWKLSSTYKRKDFIGVGNEQQRIKIKRGAESMILTLFPNKDLTSSKLNWIYLGLRKLRESEIPSFII